MRDYGFEDEAGSYACGRFTRATFCTNRNGYCDGTNSISTAGALRNPDMGYEDYIRHLEINRMDPTKEGYVVVFGRPNCTRRSAIFEGGEVNQQVEYN